MKGKHNHFESKSLKSFLYSSLILFFLVPNPVVVTANVGSCGPNAWGLYDMHGNACEWTRTTYRPYPYKADDGRAHPSQAGRKVVRGGSWCDRPKRCRSAFRLSYPAWQRVHNVGFRVVCEMGLVSSELTN